MRRLLPRWSALILVLALVAAACGDSDGAVAPVEEQPEAPVEAASDTPLAGVEVTMARANWDTGYFQASVYKTLMEELGATVSDPSQAELAPATFYPALATGEFDLWVNGWFPIHNEFLAGELPDGSVVGDKAQKIGAEIPAGGLQGFVVDIATADANGITTLDDIGNNPELAAIFDSDGNGKAEIQGCNDGWGCQVTINETIELNGWGDTLEQVSGEYAALWTNVLASYARGEPILSYTWTPSAYITPTAGLVPGEDVYWLSLSQPRPDQVGAAALPETQCPGQPCEMGFVAADIHVVVNNEFLAANPAAGKLFELVQIPVIDVALQNVKMSEGENTQPDIDRHAAEWIATNRALVDSWLTEAIAAG